MLRYLFENRQRANLRTTTSGGSVLLVVAFTAAPLTAQWADDSLRQPADWSDASAVISPLIGGSDIPLHEPINPVAAAAATLPNSRATSNFRLPSDPISIDGRNRYQEWDFATNQASPSDLVAAVPSLDSDDDAFATVPVTEAFPFTVDAQQIANEEVASLEDPTLWWNEAVGRPQLQTGTALGLTLDQLFQLAAVHSARVQVIAQQPLIAQTQIEQARAAFDPKFFNNNRFDSTSDPVESTLTTGGPPRLEDSLLGLEGGLQGQLQSGATYNLSQRFGLKNSNSTFFSPDQQGNSKLRASLGYPLLRGRTIDTPRSLVLTATFESYAAQAEFTKEFQAHLQAISNTYWRLYQERAAYLQRQRHLQRAAEIAERIEARSTYDIQQSQVLRVRAAVANRRSELANIEANVRNLESQLRAQVNAPDMLQNRSMELLPIQEPQVFPIEFDIENEVGNALANRPEFAELEHGLQAAQVRLRLARDQMRPQLNLISEAYLAGLREDYDTGAAFIDSFGDRPGYAAGVQFEQPYRQRAAKQAVNQRTYEITKISQLLRETQEKVRAEVETAIRNLAAAENTAMARYESVQAALSDLDVQHDRWITLGDDPRLGQVQLNELLLAQDRLLQEETSLLEATIQFNLAYLEFLRATGVLVVMN